MPNSDAYVLIESPDSIDCQAVIREITRTDQETPVELLDALCLIDELESTVAVELLLDRVPSHVLGLKPGGEHSAADIITAAWLTEREQLIQVHARAKLKRARSFDYYQANKSKPPKYVPLTEHTLQQLEIDIDSWYVEGFRGQGTKVEIFDNDSEVEISVLYGSLFRRQPVVNAGNFDIKSFWPVQSDLAVYNREFGELRINAKSLKEKALYCRLLGKHLFGDEDYFPYGIKYSLEPLREQGFAALVSHDFDRIRSVRMVELWLGEGSEGDQPEAELRYVIQGTDDDAVVRALLEASSPASYLGLRRGEIRFDPLGSDIWECAVRYSQTSTRASLNVGG